MKQTSGMSMPVWVMFLLVCMSLGASLMSLCAVIFDRQDSETDRITAELLHDAVLELKGKK